uniref:Cytochrome c oxidase subunit 3 n=1 Tax=Aenasius arizonensis TaxID=2058190 RepID=A0A6B9XPV0_9HYME|nr:cytochrome c oxidase subunit III [Aenasius arizonensis]QHR84891.1 cytochrome c oxidase subunit 3 [Aenasius arizonensis]
MMKMNFYPKLYQPFHLVTVSPWPILMSFSVMIFLMGVILWFHYKDLIFMIFGVFVMVLCMFQWWRDVIRESMYQGMHTYKVIKGLSIGMMLFIVSEVFFFISIFWCYFHFFLSPSIEIGALWPPKNIIAFNPYSIPLLNTVILLSSGVMITLSHYTLILNDKKFSMDTMMITLLLAFIFTLFQYMEYKEASFTISDSSYGSIFFMSTGFHGFHVIIGSIFLVVTLIRMNNNSMSWNHHLCFEMASWYWHFVDVVWLFLYLLVYFWSFSG